MILNSSNYNSTSDFVNALKGYFNDEGDIYVARVKYDLDRACQREEYLVNLFQLQVREGFLDTYPYPGFETYNPPVPTFNISYVNGFATKVVNTPFATYQPGVTVLQVFIGPLNNTIQLIGVDVILNVGGIEYLATADETNAAEFILIIPDTLYGDIVVSSSLADAASNAVAIGFHGMEIDTDTYQLEDGATYGSTRVVNGNIAVGDANSDGTINVNDLTDALTVAGSAFRKRLTNFVTVTLGSLYYNPGVGGLLNYTIEPVTEDYEFTIDGQTYTGQAKPLNRLSLRRAIHDVDGVPNVLNNLDGLDDIDLTTATLNPDGSYSGTVPVASEFNGPLLMVFSLRTATNRAILQSQTIPGCVASFSGGEYQQPDDTVTIGIANDPNSDILATTSYVQARMYDNPEFTGDVIAQAAGTISSLNSAALTLNVPKSYDRDSYIKVNYLSFYPANAVLWYDYGQSGDILARQIFESVTFDVEYYTADDQTITATIVMADGYSRTDYSLSALVVEGTSSQYYTVTSSDTSGTLTYTFTPTSGSLTGTDQMRFITQVTAV